MSKKDNANDAHYSRHNLFFSLGRFRKQLLYFFQISGTCNSINRSAARISRSKAYANVGTYERERDKKNEKRGTSYIWDCHQSVFCYICAPTRNLSRFSLPLTLVQTKIIELKFTYDREKCRTDRPRDRKCFPEPERSRFHHSRVSDSV